MSQEVEYAVHLARCSAQNCPCPQLFDRLRSDLSSRRVKTALAEDVYPPVGTTSKHFLHFTKKSLFTVVPVCCSVEDSFRECIQGAIQYRERFALVLSEQVTLPAFFKDFSNTPLYNFHERVRYDKLIGWFDENVTPDLRTKRGSKVPQTSTLPQGEDSIERIHSNRQTVLPNAPHTEVSVVPISTHTEDRGMGTPIHREGRVVRFPNISATNTYPFSEEIVSPKQRQGRGLSFENPSDTSSYPSVSAYGGDEYWKFVSLPNLEEPESHHPDCGPIARRLCTTIDEESRRTWTKDLVENRLYLRLTHSETQDTKRDVIIFIFQTFCSRSLNISLPLAIQLMRCNEDSLCLHGIRYMECKLLRWDVFIMEDKYEELISAEEELFYVLNEQELSVSIPNEHFSRVTCIYVLTLSLLCSGFEQQSSKTRDKVKLDLRRRALLVGSNSEDGIQNLCRKALGKILQQAVGKKDEKSVTACVLKLQTTLRSFYRDQDERSLKNLKHLISKIQPRSALDKLLARPNPERSLFRQLIIRAIVTSLKDGCGRVVGPPSSSDDMEQLYISSMLGVLQMSVEQGTSGLHSEWMELYKQELRPLLLHDNPTISCKVRQLAQYDMMSVEQKEQVIHKDFASMFSTVGLELQRPCSGDQCKVEQGQRWRHYLGRIGGSQTSQLCGSFASIIYNPFRDSDDCSGLYDYGFDGDIKRKTECKLLASMDRSLLIVQLLAINSAPGRFAYVLEKPQGGSLQQMLLDRRQEGNWLSLVELQNIAMQMIQAIEFCHDQHVLHRDIRTENFHYCSALKLVKLDNFGLGSQFDDSHVKTDVDKTEIAILWSSPETLTEGKTSCSSDIWMLGQTLLELYLHGYWPYSEWLRTNTALDVVQWIAYKCIRPMEPTGCIPTEVLRVIFSCLEMDEDKRLTAAELRDAFNKITQRKRYTQNDFHIEGLSLDRLPYPGLCAAQQAADSKALKGIPKELRLFDPSENPANTVAPSPWEQDNIEEDDPEFQHLEGKIVIKEQPFYEHTREEVNCLATDTPGLVRLTEQTRHADGTTLTSVCPSPEAKKLSDVVWTYRSYKSEEFIDFVLCVFTDVTHSLQILHHNWCIHRDICARHILVDPYDKRGYLYRIARVRQIKKNLNINPAYKEDGTIQEKFSRRMRWFPVEVLLDSYFSRESDVYMLAVTIWDVLNNINNRRKNQREQLPFGGVKPENLADHLAKGGTLPQPDTCPDWLYQVLQKCWSVRVERPTMPDVKRCLESRSNVLPSVQMRFHKRQRNPNCFSTPLNEDFWFRDEDTVPKRHFGSAIGGPLLRVSEHRHTGLGSSVIPPSNMARLSKNLLTLPPGSTTRVGYTELPQRNAGRESSEEYDNLYDDAETMGHVYSHINHPNE